jgi:5'(3')-deoxyribonucleotidase
MSKSKVFNEKAKGYQIFLDMDGVISDLDTHAAKTGKYDESGKLQYDALDLNWWSSMPVFWGAKSFHKKLKTLGTVRFLTAPTLSKDCFGGKANWITDKFNSGRGRFALLDLIICRGSDKNLLARDTHILVDDRENNVKAWQEAGGIGVHHKGDFKKTLARVEEVIKNAELGKAAKLNKKSENIEIFLDKNNVIADIIQHGHDTDKFISENTLDYPNLDYEWWRDMPVFDGAREFHSALKEIGDVRFLTAPVPIAGCFRGTAEWLSDTFILIDDRKQNIEDWKKAGGIGVLHEGDFSATLKKVKAHIASIKQNNSNKPSAPRFL